MPRRSGRSRYADQSEPTSEFAAEDEINNYEAEAEDEIDDEEQEVTRCVCEQDELNTALVNPQLSEVLIKEYSIKIDQGLFIQCDKCSVWQHGYCVGLFTNDEVPDKYWCELCKPDLHVFIYDNGEAVRTLYRPVNEKRRKLSLESLAAGQSIQQKTSSRSRTKRSASANSNSNDNSREREKESGNNGKSRKERRHYDESYDEQLQKALRESAKESGLPLDSETSSRRSNNNSNNNNSNNNNIADSDTGEHEASNIEEDNEDESKPKYDTRRTKPKTNSSKSASNDEASNGNSAFSKEELVNQPSKPRYVSDKSSIYELRKRTGAILEWLGRSQLELEDEKVNKIQLFTFKEKTESDQNVIDEDGNKVIVKFDENLKLMESLTEKILAWEQKFGKYAP
ncbi:hypothetical protein PICST_76943 [Scheffersomyces stipitis CBS 6054]|uniref:Zinc finger PHD-type domain-containing protein n=1 Tax=Scheffersomyces stipitis (strain ATCC 58785 / CBS 6054 / NBRC 10063 / NRRL Y-11545) TaxID=322104 RepID=A3LRH8_PICST|nr:hypothetical protein PICST_76943 [Scheffersomyces stipitis CBS 6054]ABN65389.2 hypothetical protein PICST_76943 [Scheffersomyces stipitis CBS 6054]